ncbi:hypothetical protein [Polaribacter sp. R77954]|uniref:hypothetical protein n=1 Tax=Polaribacter sp. R77954 TaxID=3093870 RepID=UPI0037CA409D
MKKIICLIIILNSLISFSQKKSEIYVKIDKVKGKNLYALKKTSQNLQIKIIFFEKRNNGFKKNTKKNNDDELIILEPIPNEYYYEFKSIGEPVKVSNINKLNYYNVEDISKHKIWNKTPPHSLIFIEKLNDCNYNLWKMYPIMKE